MENFLIWILGINIFAVLMFILWLFDNRASKRLGTGRKISDYHVCCVRNTNTGDNSGTLFDMDLYTLMNHIDFQRNFQTSFYSRSIIHFIGYKME